MLTNLDWLANGQKFPPVCERDRLARYRGNKLIFENEHHEVYSEQLKRIERVIGDLYDKISYPITLNFQKKVSLKTADFLFLEAPSFSIEGEMKQKALKEITTDIDDTGYQGVIDCSRYGDCVLKINVEDNKGVIGISSPEYLFKVVDPADRKKVTQYVLAWTYDIGEGNKRKTFLSATVHEKTKYSTYTYEISSGIIKKLVDSKENVETGLSDFAIIPISNIVTSDRIWGIDDYEDIDSVVAELEIRVAQVSKILDKFSSPTAAGSENALEEETDGSHTFKAGNYYAYENGDPKLEYITWEANLDANFTQIEKLLNFLSTLSEMGSAIFNDALKTGQIPSGSALKKLYINALAKVARTRKRFDKGLKKAISLASEIGYPKISEDEISINWKDGLPEDPKEEAEILNIRTGNKPTMSVKRGLREYDGLTEKAAEEEIEAINEDEIKANSTLVMSPTGGDVDDDE